MPTAIALPAVTAARRTFTVAVAVAVAVALLPTPADAAPQVDPRPRTSTERAGEQLVFDQHNQARHDPSRFGHPGETPVAALEWDEHLAQVARQWSDIMAQDGRMRHNPHFREQSEWPYGVGENVVHSGWGASNIGAAGLTQWWMDSDGHRDNIMRPTYEAVGIGLSIDWRGEVWATAVFRVAPPDDDYDDDYDDDWDEHEWDDEWSQGPAQNYTPRVRDLSSLCPAVARSRFVDVTRHVDAVECLAEREITLGVSPDRFDPSGTVTRGQMAVFLDRAITGLDGQLPDGPDAAFSDVTGGQRVAIGRLVEAGIVSGYPDGTYRPQRPVTREQMAHFLVATHELLQGERTRGPLRSWFTDNHSDDRFHRQVNVAADLGLAAGTDGRFNHRSPVRRDHMALFLLRLVVAQDDDSFKQQYPG